ncbi:MAG: hypothetical protein KF822_03765 [Steroidobacteraceae bacterium]|nr:hypothetical protein [Steroidobacteraceae bacterium]
MQGSFRMAHLVVGAIAVVAFLITGQVMGRLDPPVADMEWAERLLFRSRHIYILAAGLVNLALGVNYQLPAGAARRGMAVAGSLLVLASALLLFFAFFAEPMAGRWPGPLSMLGLQAMFGGVLLYTVVNLRHRPGRTT